MLLISEQVQISATGKLVYMQCIRSTYNCITSFKKNIYIDKSRRMKKNYVILGNTRIEEKLTVSYVTDQKKKYLILRFKHLYGYNIYNIYKHM